MTTATTNRVAKFYSVLTPRERMQAIQSASMRNDVATRQHLVDSAPASTFKVSDHHGPSTAMRGVAQVHQISQLENLTLYWNAQSMLLAGSRIEDEATRDERDDMLAEFVWMCGHRHQVNAAGWNLFCQKLGVDPAFNLIGTTSDSFEAGSEIIEPRNVPDGAAMARIFPGKVFKTAEDIAGEYLELFEYFESQWQ